MARRLARLALVSAVAATHALVGGPSSIAAGAPAAAGSSVASGRDPSTAAAASTTTGPAPGSMSVIAGVVPVNRLTAPVCGTAPAPAPAPTESPWPQQRYLPDRLTTIATGAGVRVAVIDSGVDSRHPQLRGRVAAGTDFLDPGGDGSRDCAGHGTAVASIIAATPRGGTPFRGLAPDARILPVRVSEQQVIDGTESGRTVTTAQFARSIRWAVDHDADVINLSVVLYQDDPAVRAAIGYAVAKNVVVVAAAGNLHEAGDPTPYPAAYDNVLGVGAIGRDGKRAQFSQVGPYVDLVAPGSEVLAATAGHGQQRQEGTSYAAPFVSATAALIRQYWPALTAAQVAERIISTADPAPGGDQRGGGYGAGVLNPYRAVTETGAAARPLPVAAPSLPAADPAVAARDDRRSRAGREALFMAAGAGGLVALVALAAVVLPRGARRRWRPARTGIAVPAGVAPDRVPPRPG